MHRARPSDGAGRSYPGCGGIGSSIDRQQDCPMNETDLKSRRRVDDEVVRTEPSITDGPDATDAAAATSHVLRSDAPVNILIVDDEPKNLTVLEAILDDPGYRLVRAESAEQALLALLADEFALLILDIRMPGVAGFELAQM